MEGEDEGGKWKLTIREMKEGDKKGLGTSKENKCEGREEIILREREMGKIKEKRRKRGYNERGEKR